MGQLYLITANLLFSYVLWIVFCSFFFSGDERSSYQSALLRMVVETLRAPLASSPNCSAAAAATLREFCRQRPERVQRHALEEPVLTSLAVLCKLRPLLVSSVASSIDQSVDPSIERSPMDGQLVSHHLGSLLQHATHFYSHEYRMNQ